MKCRAIEALAGRYPVAPMCRLLRVSRSGFYAWQQRPPSAREMANRRLSKEIRTIHHEVNGIVASRPSWRPWGMRVVGTGSLA
uniref:Transposase derived protein n=1 Tax=Pseudomonas aeruginosa TaxID=287 RepID=Q1W4X9_PSEAI|nr:transposase derived protein [Pseudomonas aeruginosa]